MREREEPARVSVHGGHSGEFCNHARDSLEKIVEAYIAHSYSWVGITEHMPAVSDEFLYADEKEAGLTAAGLLQRFSQYIRECRRLQKKYARQITLFVGMEIETYSGSLRFASELIERFNPDYIVGSVHHVNDIPIDYSIAEYNRAIENVGGIEALYCRYFDQQFEMLQRLKPAVVGHFDLIRIFDSQYEKRLQEKVVKKKIERNLTFIRDNELVLDYNLRALMKGAKEPYVSLSILTMACQLGIAVVPGDDSHGVDTVGLHFDDAVKRLRASGCGTYWKRPNSGKREESRD